MSGLESANIDPIMDAIIDLTVEMLSARMFKSQIKKTLREIMGEDTDFRRLEDVMSAARARLLEIVKTDPEDHRARAIALYEAIIRDQESSPRDKLAAQDALLGLLGIGAKYNLDRGQTIAERARAIREAVAGMDASMSLDDGEPDE